MSIAKATIDEALGGRIAVRTQKERGLNDFEYVLAQCKRVPGGAFRNRKGDKFWHYPLSVDVCHALRRVFGKKLLVGNDLADWYREAKASMDSHAELANADDAPLDNVPEEFSTWLHGYQRAGARWIAEGYRGAGLVADKPGVGKTPETLAAMIESGVRGPVLVLCPKKAVRLTWGLETRRHLAGVPLYLCVGTRERREATLDRFARDMAKDPDALRIVVIVAEMLRVKLGNPCFTKEVVLDKDGNEVERPKNKVSGMCPQLRRNPNLLKCTLHLQVPPPEGSSKGAVKKWKVPTGFEYPQLFNERLLRGGWSWVVLDESHKLLGSLTVSKGNLMGKGLRLLPERPDRRRYALSGTPMGKGGRLEGLFGTLHWLWPDEYTSYWRWIGEHFEVITKRINRYGDTANEVGPVKGLSPNASIEEETEAWETLIQSLGPRVLRRTKEEVMKHLPPKTYFEVVCGLSPEQRKQYEELMTYAEVTTPTGVIAANGALALLTRAKQISLGELVRGAAGKAQFGEASGKLDRLWDNLDERGILDGEPGDKIVIASRYNEFLDAIGDYLELDRVPFFRLDGKTTERVAESQVSAWQSGQCKERVFLVNVKAGGVSINLDAADELHMMDEDPDPGVNEQMEDRIHRASRVHKVRIYNYRTEGTLEYKQAHDVEYRRRVQHAVLDGKRGLEYVSKLLLDSRGLD